MKSLTMIDAIFYVRLTMTLVHFLWQGVVLYVAAKLAMLVLRHASAHVRYTVLLTALLIMAACPPATFMLINTDWVTTDNHSVRQWMETTGGSRPDVDRDDTRSTNIDRNVVDSSVHSTYADHLRQIDWRVHAPRVALVYLICVTAMFVRLSLAVYGGQRLRRCSEPVGDAIILTALARQAKAMSLSFTPAIAYCRDVMVPTVVGVLRPMIVLPISLSSGLTPEQVETLLSHELAHLHRYDHLVNFLQRLIEVFLFYHPAMWAISRSIRIERENCCDDLVLVTGSANIDYAESLVRVAEIVCGENHSRSLATTLALGAGGQRSQLYNRVMRILGAPMQTQMRLVQSWTLVICCCVLLVIVAAIGTNTFASEGQGKARLQSANTQPTTRSTLSSFAEASQEQKEPSDRDDVVREGVGYEKIKLGMTPEQVIAALGAPEDRVDSPHVWLVYRKGRGIDVIFPGGVAAEIRFNPGFKGKLSRGPGIGTPMSAVLRTYGTPVATKQASQNDNLFEDRVLYELPRAWKIVYRSTGVLFWFDAKKNVSQFVIARKSGSPNGVVTLVPPYPSSYKNAPVNKISVQYAVIDIAKQAGYGYEWEDSYTNTDPVCRQWIQPGIRAMPFPQAMDAILSPVGLRYEIRDKSVVLLRK